MGLIAFGLGFTACNTNDDDMPIIEKGEKAKVSVRVAVNRQATRLAGDLSGIGTNASGLVEEARIHSLEAWVFNADGTLDGYGNSIEFLLEMPEKTPTEFPYISNIPATAGIGKQLVVAANTNIGEVGINNLADLKAKFATLTENDTPPDIAKKIGLPMTSLIISGIELLEGENLFGPAAGTHHDPVFSKNANPVKVNGVEVTGALLLTRLHARVALVGLDYDFMEEMTQETPKFDRFVLKEVAMFNVREQSKFLSDATGRILHGTVNNFLWGKAYPPLTDAYVNTGSATASLLQKFVANDALDAHDAILHARTLVNATNAHYFYVFENDATSGGNKTSTGANMKGTYFVLAGELWLGEPGAGGTKLTDPLFVDPETGFTFYTIFVNGDRANYDFGLGGAGVFDKANGIGDNNLYRNTQYNLSVTLKHAGQPTVGIENAFLDVVVEVAEWAVVGQTIVF